jgi:hypothetical protein
MVQEERAVTCDICDRLKKARHEGVDPVPGSRMVEVPVVWVDEAVAAIERLRLKAWGLEASRDYAVERLASAIGVYEKDRALEWFASEAARKIVELTKAGERSAEHFRGIAAGLAQSLDLGVLHAGPPTDRRWAPIQERARELVALLQKMIEAGGGDAPTDRA